MNCETEKVIKEKKQTLHYQKEIQPSKQSKYVVFMYVFPGDELNIFKYLIEEEKIDSFFLKIKFKVRK